MLARPAEAYDWAYDLKQISDHLILQFIIMALPKQTCINTMMTNLEEIYDSTFQFVYSFWENDMWVYMIAPCYFPEPYGARNF